MTSEEPSNSRKSRPTEGVDSASTNGLRSVVSGREVSLNELTDDMEGVKALIRSGEARLEVVVRPWGLEFNLVAAASQRTGSLASVPTPALHLARHARKRER